MITGRPSSGRDTRMAREAACFTAKSHSVSYLDRLRHNKPIVVHGDGQGLWSALHADDVARVFAAAAGNPAAVGSAYNAAGEEWMTWDRYHADVAKAMAVELPPLLHIPVEALCRLAPARAAQCKRSLQYPGIYDMSKAREELGFRQRIPFTEGIGRTVRWLAAHAAVESWQSDSEYERVVDAWQRLQSQLPAESK